MYRLYREVDLQLTADACWDFFSDPENLEIITPDSLSFEIINGAGEKMHPGQLIEYRVRPMGPMPMKWVTEITHVVDHELFVDEQRFGPYAFWHHKHRFIELENGMRCIDELHYLPPGNFLNGIINSLFIKERLDEIFDFRRQKLIQMFGECKNRLIIA